MCPGLMAAEQTVGQDMSASRHAIVLCVFVWSPTRAFNVMPVVDI